MKVISKKEAKKMIRSHQRWLEWGTGGECADFSAAVLENIDFSKANLDRAIFRGAQLRNCDFSYAEATRTDFSCATLHGCDFSRANLARALFLDAVMEQISFLFANLREVKFDMAEMQTVALSWANIAKTDFTGVDMTDINLRMVDLSYAILPEQIVKVGPLQNEETNDIIYFVNSDFVQSLRLREDSKEGHSLDDFEKALTLFYEREEVKKMPNYAKCKAEHFAALAMFRLLKNAQTV